MGDEIDVATCCDEELLTNLVMKTTDMTKRKEIRNRLKEIRSSETAKFEARQKERESTAQNLDSVKNRAEAAAKDRERKLKSYEAQAATCSPGQFTTEDPVKNQHERDVQSKADTMKAFELKAKAGGTTEFQGGLEAIKKIDQAHNEAERARMMDQFNRMSNAEPPPGESNVSMRKTPVKKPNDSRPKSAMNMFKAADAAANPAGSRNSANLGATKQSGGTNLARSPTNAKATLLKWCQAMTKDYPIEINNFSGSWADGMAFCAIVHHFFPDAFDFASLSSKNRRENFQLAFDTAEQRADLMPLLEVNDMIMMKDNPDWKCVYTYVQEMYKKFINFK